MPVTCLFSLLPSKPTVHLTTFSSNTTPLLLLLNSLLYTTPHSSHMFSYYHYFTFPVLKFFYSMRTPPLLFLKFYRVLPGCIPVTLFPVLIQREPPFRTLSLAHKQTVSPIVLSSLLTHYKLVHLIGFSTFNFI